MIRAALAFLRPPVIAATWVALASGADWIPVRILAVGIAGLVSVTVTAALRVSDGRDKSLLIRAVADLTKNADLAPSLRRVK